MGGQGARPTVTHDPNSVELGYDRALLYQDRMPENFDFAR